MRASLWLHTHFCFSYITTCPSQVPETSGMSYKIFLIATKNCKIIYIKIQDGGRVWL